MRFERAKNPGGPTPEAPSPRFQIVTSRATVSRNPEIRSDDEWLYVNLHVPEIHQGRFRYSISKRYLLVWSDGSSHAQHQFVILPRPVEPKDHHVTFKNGVVDARIRIRSQ